MKDVLGSECVMLSILFSQPLEAAATARWNTWAPVKERCWHHNVTTLFLCSSHGVAHVIWNLLATEMVHPSRIALSSRSVFERGHRAEKHLRALKATPLHSGKEWHPQDMCICISYNWNLCDAAIGITGKNKAVLSTIFSANDTRGRRASSCCPIYVWHIVVNRSGSALT